MDGPPHAYLRNSDSFRKPNVYLQNGLAATEAYNMSNVISNRTFTNEVYNISTVISNRVSRTRSGFANLANLSHISRGHSAVECHSHKINLALFNIRSLLNKPSTVNDLICDEKLDILFLTETWLGTDGNVALALACPPKYSFLHSVRGGKKGKKGGGLACIFSDTFKFKSLSLGDFTSFEYQASILENESSVLMISIYRPPKCSKPLFLTEISDLLSICFTDYNRILLTGDLNLHIDNASDTAAMSFLQLLHSFDFTQHVTGPTHKHGHTLDLVISRGLNVTVEKTIVMPDLSDHYLLCFHMAVSDLGKTTTEHTIKKRFFSSSAAEEFSGYLTCAPPLSDMSSVNDMLKDFNFKLESALDIVAPMKTKKKHNSRLTPWINEHLHSLKRERRRAERAWRKNKLTINLEILKRSTVAYNKAIRLARQAYFSGIINENKNNARVLFSTIERLLDPPQSYKQSPSASKAKCNEFASFFDNKILNLRAGIMINANTNAANTNSQTARWESVDKPRGSLISFCTIDEEELRKAISQMTSSSCSLDAIPTPFLKKVLDSLIGDILKIVNSSLESGVFPDSLKTAVVKPLLKKRNLDPSVLGNFRPISNLPFLGKILEKIVFQQLDVFLQDNKVHNKFQSGFRKGHSTETALLKVVNDLRVSADNRNVSVLLLLDLTAAFDTIDHTILIHRLEHWIGLSGSALSWFYSYLTGRSYFVNLDDFESDKHDICSGIPQGSILGPLLFSLYILPLGELIAEHGVNFHFYADDTQLYLSVAPDDPCALDPLLACVSSIKCWMSENFLKLNEDKTEVLIIGSSEQRESITSRLGNLAEESNTSVKNLGVIIDSELNFNTHINHVTKIAFFHLRNIARIRNYLSLNDAKTLIHAFVFSRLDYCNAILSGLPKKETDRLQLVQNAAARVLTKTKMREHITPVLASLHWLPVVFRIDYKILLLVYKALNGLAPSYLSDCLPRYVPGRHLRSSNADLLDPPPKMNYKKYGEASFCFYGPTAWNKLPLHLRQAVSVDSFKAQLKTYFFTLAFGGV